MKTRSSMFLAVGLLMAWVSAVTADLTNVWNFTNPPSYDLSAPSLIEVNGTNAQLVLQAEDYHHATIPTYTNDTVFSRLAFGPDVSVRLSKTGALYEDFGVFVSRVIDGLDGRWTTMKAKIDGTWLQVEVNVTSIAGFLLAKTAAAYSRRKPKDWYDITFVLRNNDFGGIEGAANAVRLKFGDKLETMHVALHDLRANFDTPKCQGPQAYADQMLEDHPSEDRTTLLADAVVTVNTFYSLLFPK